MCKIIFYDVSSTFIIFILPPEFYHNCVNAEITFDLNEI